MHPIIFVALVLLDQSVHLQTQGLSRCVMQFVEANGEQDARAAIQRHFAHKSLNVQHIALSEATQQNRSRYVIPETLIRANAAV